MIIRRVPETFSDAEKWLRNDVSRNAVCARSKDRRRRVYRSDLAKWPGGRCFVLRLERGEAFIDVSVPRCQQLLMAMLAHAMPCRRNVPT